jgi:hypothetical protein
LEWQRRISALALGGATISLGSDPVGRMKTIEPLEDTLILPSSN